MTNLFLIWLFTINAFNNHWSKSVRFNSLSSFYEYDPKLSWFVFETEHFAIHIPSRVGLNKEEEELARRIAWTCETTDSLLVPIFGERPKGKVNVVIADFYDYAQGWSIPFPHNTITVMPTHPAGDLTNYDDWFRTLILHEYTHTLQMDKVGGFFRFLRTLLGRMVVPNTLTPLWLLEGYAIYNETRFTQFGRGISPEYRMKIKADILANRLLPIDQTTTYELRKYPGAEAPYIYGSQFLFFLAGQFGEERLVQYVNYNSSLLPFFANFSARKVFGSNLYNLWRNWQNNIRTDSQTFKTDTLTAITQVTKVGFEMYAPLFSKYGEKIYYISYNPNQLPAIKSLDLITKETETLVKGVIGKSLSVSPDGSELLFSQRNLVNNYYDYDDIFLYNLTTKEVRRLTRNKRARDPDFAPDGKKIVFVENGLGKNRLLLFDRMTNQIETLLVTEDHTQYSQPKFSPDGKKIALAIWQEGGYQDILVIDLISGWKMPLTFDPATDITPTWTPDGKYLLFSSDRTGIFNLYAYSFEYRQIYQITDVMTGAFAPTVSPDGKRIAFLLYSDKGYDVHFINFKPSTWKKSEAKSEDLVEPILKSVRGNLYQYDPLASLLPRFWLPIVYYDTTFRFGFFTAGIDILFQHIIILTVSYQPSSKNPFIYLSYLSQKYPFGFYSYYERTEQGFSIYGYIPFYSTFSYHWFMPYYEFNRHSSEIASGLGLEFEANNAKRYHYSISPVDGRDFWLNLVNFNRYIGSTNNLTKLIGSYSEYIGLGRHNVLMLRLNFGTGFGDSVVKRQYQLGGALGIFSVRGYERELLPTQNIVKTTVEYRFPLYWVERGLGTAPFFLSNFSGILGMDYGLAWDSYRALDLKMISKQSKLGVFGELKTSLVVAYFLPLSVKIGYGFGLINRGENQIYCNISSSILNLLSEKRRLSRKDINNLILR
ncbi:MAG: hypothetical protein ABIK67_05235 [candidate division WOR-3 bacterium]